MNVPLIQRLAFLVALLAFTTLARARPVAAQECYDENGLPRKCTFTETSGECLWNAQDSYNQCLQRARSYWDEVACNLAWEFDASACVVESLGRFALNFLSSPDN